MSDYRLYKLYNDTKTKSNPLNILIFDWDDSQSSYFDFGLLIKPHASEILGTVVSTPTNLFTGEKGKGQYYIVKTGGSSSNTFGYNYYIYNGADYTPINRLWGQRQDKQGGAPGDHAYYTCNPNLIIFYKSVNSGNYYLTDFQCDETNRPIAINPDKASIDWNVTFYTRDVVKVTSTETANVSVFPGKNSYWTFTPSFGRVDYTDLCNWIEHNIKPIDFNDPDPNINDSDGDHGRTPTDNIGGDTIGDDDLPTLSVMDTGLVTLYNPTVEELSSLGRFLWSDAFSVDTFKKLFSDPFDTLLGLSILPVSPTVSGRHSIYFGNIDSGVSCNVVANQFLKVDMGSLTLSETYASAFDYAPSTQVDIYLPFIGSHGLNTNDVMGSKLHLIYKFDLLSGGCIAELFINHTSQGNKSKGLSYNPNMGLAYTFSGQCSCSIPLTSNNYNGMIQSIIQSVGTIGGIGASVATGNPALGIASVATSAASIGLQANTPTVQRSGSIGSSNALLSCLTPYLSVQRAHVCKPGHFYSKRGIPSQVYVDNISSVGTGNYFQISDCVDLHANGASDTELAEIKNILTSGAVW